MNSKPKQYFNNPFEGVLSKVVIKPHPFVQALETIAEEQITEYKRIEKEYGYDPAQPGADKTIVEEI